MSMNFGLIYLIGVVFFTHTQETFAKHTTRQEVVSQLACISKWQKLKPNWNFTVTNLSRNHNFNSFWSQNKEDFKSQTVKRLLLTVIYRQNFTKTFSCHGTISSYIGALTAWRNNVSFDVQLPNVGSELLGVRFMSLLGFERRLEFYIRPRTNINDVSYTLYYCLHSEDKILSQYLNFQKNYTCPRHSSVKFSCSQRENNVFEIPNSVGIVCEASTREYAYTDTNYNFYIRTETRDGSHSVSSHDFRIHTKESSYEPISRYANQGLFTAVLIGRKPSYLTTDTTDQRAVLTWENTDAKTYLVTYTCSNGFNSNQTIEVVNTLTIYNKIFTPYTLCKFCVASQHTDGSLFSEPMCNATRFPEKAPSKPPTITCDSETCPTTTYDEERAVTVECMFPKPNTTNGLLNKLVLNYWNDTNNSGDFEKFVTTNLTLCQVRVKNLSKKHAYFAQMSVCNSKGCSGLSDQVLIAKAIPINARRSVFSKLGLGLLIAIPTGVLIIAVILSVKRHRRLTQPEQVTALPRIEEPNNYEHLETNLGQPLHQYDELSKEDDNRNVFDNSC